MKLYLFNLNYKSKFTMKRLNLLIVALATLSFVAFYGCQNTGKTEDKAVEETTEEVVQEETTAEEEIVEDTTVAEEVVADTVATEEQPAE